jgi:protein-tyrosine phosphatase
MAEMSVIFVCLGNICRSPTARGLFEAKAKAAGIRDKIRIDSAGTSGYHVGDRPDPGAIRVCHQMGVDISEDRSRKVTPADLQSFDYVIAMDNSNYRDMLRVDSQAVDRLYLMRQFEPGAKDMDVPDPWGGGIDGFERMCQIIERSVEGLLEKMISDHPQPGG